MNNDNKKVTIQVRTKIYKILRNSMKFLKILTNFLMELNNDFYSLYEDDVIIEKVDLNNIKKY